MRQPVPEEHDYTIPSIGDRVELRRAGTIVRGTVQYADSIQFLVKWDDGTSSSLRVGHSPIRIVRSTP